MYKVTIENDIDDSKFVGKCDGITIWSLVKAFKKAMKKEGWTKDQRNAVTYDHSKVCPEDCDW